MAANPYLSEQRRSPALSVAPGSSRAGVLLLGLAFFLVAGPAAAQSNIPFTIIGGEVIPGEPFVVRATVLGAALQSTGFGYDYQVGARVTIDGSQFEPWGLLDEAIAGNLNDDNNPRQWVAPGLFPGSVEIGITGRSWNKKKPAQDDGSQESHWEEYSTRDSWEGSDRVIVLRDGDDVPDVAGFADQPSLLEFIGDYIDTTTSPFTVDLTANEAIFLFELGTKPVGNPACDYQDLVVLIRLAEHVLALDLEGLFD